MGKSVTDVKSFKRAFKCRQAELTSSSRLDFTSNSVHTSQNKKVVKIAPEIN